MTTKFKSKKLVKAKTTSDLWETIEGDVAVITKTYFYNGECHYKGFWKKNGAEFDLPTVFFIDIK